MSGMRSSSSAEKFPLRPSVSFVLPANQRCDAGACRGRNSAIAAVASDGRRLPQLVFIPLSYGRPGIPPTPKPLNTTPFWPHGESGRHEVLAPLSVLAPLTDGGDDRGGRLDLRGCSIQI